MPSREPHDHSSAIEGLEFGARVRPLRPNAEAELAALNERLQRSIDAQIDRFAAETVRVCEAIARRAAEGEK